MLVDDSLLFRAVGLLEEVDGFENVLIRESLQAGGIIDDALFDFPEHRSESLTRFVKFSAFDQIFLLPELGRILLDGLIGLSRREVGAVRGTLDLGHALLPAALGTDGGVLGGAESLAFSLITQDALHKEPMAILHHSGVKV